MNEALTENAKSIIDYLPEWKEVSIDIEWGTLRGKILGSGPRKVLAVHGWMDNANSFNLVTPYIEENNTILSIDLPGHGLSDHFPSGFIYDKKGYIAAVKKLVLKLNWPKFTYIGHSIGAIIGIVYASVFPEDIDTLISIDIIKPWSYKAEDYASNIRKYIKEYFKNEEFRTKEPLKYNESELVDKIISTTKSLDSKSAKILLERSSKLSDCATKRVLTRDLRAKVYFIGFIPREAWFEFAKSIHCPILIIKATKGRKYDSTPDQVEMLKNFESGSSLFQYSEVEGDHHIHLTHSEVVGPILSDFLKRTFFLAKLELDNSYTNGSSFNETAIS